MTWRAVIAALDEGETFRSRVSVYLHPMAGRPILWHVIRALSEAPEPPEEISVLYRASQPMTLPPAGRARVRATAVQAGSELIALRAALTSPGQKLLIDGLAPLIAPPTIARLLRAGEQGIAALVADGAGDLFIAVSGEGPALASSEDPRSPRGVTRVASTTVDETMRISDRLIFSDASVAMRDRTVRAHATRGVTFVLPQTTWVDVDVRIGTDTVIYPGVVLEGMTEIGTECVIGPHSRLVEATIGKGVELKGWNYVTRTRIRNHAVLEPYVRRGFD